MAERDSGATQRAIVRREVLRFAIPGVLGLVLLALASLTASVAVAREQAINEARTSAQWLARTVVEPRLDSGLRSGAPARMAELDAAFSASIRDSDVKAIRLWNPEGVIIYSNDPRLIGERFPMPGTGEGGTVQGLADPDRPENRYLDPELTWVQVSLPVVGQDGSRYLFQISELSASLHQEARDVWMSFAPILAGSMILLALLLVLLGVRMARRISAELRTREQLLQRAVDASEAERRRIAADLHDGTVQQLAGLSFALAGMAAQARDAGDADLAGSLTQAAQTSRTSVGELRTLLVDIYPPNLDSGGLAAAIAELLDGVGPGLRVDSQLTDPPGLDRRDRAALYRVAREAITNVVKHSGAARVTVRLMPVAGTVRLAVVDDGCGFDLAADPGDHLGLRLMEDLVASVGGRLAISSAPGAGTSVTVDLERR